MCQVVVVSVYFTSASLYTTKINSCSAKRAGTVGECEYINEAKRLTFTPKTTFLRINPTKAQFHFALGFKKVGTELILTNPFLCTRLNMSTI